MDWAWESVVATWSRRIKNLEDSDHPIHIHTYSGIGTWKPTAHRGETPG